MNDQERDLVTRAVGLKAAPKIVLKTAATLSIADIRDLFETSSDANAVRDCVRAIGAGAGGVFASEIKDYQRDAATDRLVIVFNAGRAPRVVTRYRDFTVASVEFHQPYFIDGLFIRSGYNVCSSDGMINVMPGACWFMTIADATRGIDCLLEAGGMPGPPYETDEGVADRFWLLMSKVRGKST